MQPCTWRVARASSHRVIAWSVGDNIADGQQGEEDVGQLDLVLERTRIQRPTLDDVQRLSEGRAAKTRGWGSRQVCHRLNADERTQYRLALEKGWLTLVGTGYRKERKGAPLANIYRQYCDAKAMLCVNVLLAGTDSFVLVEQSTLRQWEVDEVRGLVVDTKVQEDVRSRIETAAKVATGATSLGDVEYVEGRALADLVPWTVLAPPDVVEKNTGEDLDADVVAHYCSSAIWTIPVSVVGVRVGNRGLAKEIAKAMSERVM